MENRTSQVWIEDLKENEIFCFGSNTANRHGAGAAKFALKFGAIYGHHRHGRQGQTYAIPTKNFNITRSLDLDEIGLFVDEFIEYAKQNSDLTFLVTEIGCMLAGYEPEQIAPLFKKAIDVENIHLPERFWNVLKNL